MSDLATSRSSHYFLWVCESDRVDFSTLGGFVEKKQRCILAMLYPLKVRPKKNQTNSSSEINIKFLFF